MQLEHNRNNFGEKHIERTARLKDLKAAGFNNARDFVEILKLISLFKDGIGKFYQTLLIAGFYDFFPLRWTYIDHNTW